METTDLICSVQIYLQQMAKHILPSQRSECQDIDIVFPCNECEAKDSSAKSGTNALASLI